MLAGVHEGKRRGAGFRADRHDAVHPARHAGDFGNTVSLGEPMRSACAETAKLLVAALDDMAATSRIVDIARRNFPELRVLAWARNRRPAFVLMDRGIDGLARDTFHASLELGRVTR